MPMITLKSKSPIGQLIEGHLQAGLVGRPETARQGIEAELRRIEARCYEQPEQDLERARSSGQWTPDGMKVQARTAVGQGRNELKFHRATNDRRKAAVEATRAKASETPGVERTVEVLLRERELRDRVAGLKDRLMARPMYLEAIDNGDWELVRAIEAAPRAFQLVDAATREEGAKRKIAKSPLARQLAEQEAEVEIFGQVLAAIETELGKLAERYGVTLEG